MRKERSGEQSNGAFGAAGPARQHRALRRVVPGNDGTRPLYST